MRILKIAAMALIVPVLSGCMKYTYGGRTFYDRNEAEAAQKADLATIRAAFKPRSTPLAKAGRVVLPAKTLLIDRGTREGASTEARDYVASSLYTSYRDMAETIRQRNIFDRLDIEESADGGHVTPKANEAVIYIYWPDNKTSGWYYISKTTKLTPLHLDQGNPDKVGKVKYFYDSIEALAAGEPN
jgi:hypothetical protein